MVNGPNRGDPKGKLEAPRRLPPDLAVATARLVAGGFAGIVGLGTLLLLPGVTRSSAALSFLDALFTATSAVCVTGLVVRDTATTFTPMGQWILLALIQLGGLGCMTCASVVVLAAGRSLGIRSRMQLLHSYEQPSLGAVPRIARSIVLTALVAEGIGAALLAVCLWITERLAPRDALSLGAFHAVSSYCNAGFDVMGAIHGPYSSLARYVDHAAPESLRQGAHSLRDVRRPGGAAHTGGRPGIAAGAAGALPRGAGLDRIADSDRLVLAPFVPSSGAASVSPGVEAGGKGEDDPIEARQGDRTRTPASSMSAFSRAARVWKTACSS
jgi:hypothetical protein